METPTFAEVLHGMRQSHETVILDFREIDDSLPDYANIQKFFTSQSDGDPRSPENRQRFNANFLEHAMVRYLIGRYGEDRIEMLRGSQIANEGRTIHLGVDLFTRDLEPVYTPYDGTVVASTREEGSHTFGYYVIVEHLLYGDALYSLYGHLGKDLPAVGTTLRSGEQFARLGDFVHNENGGWSRHLHFQLLRHLPRDSQAPIGYSTPANFPINRELFPDPNFMLQLE